MAEEHRPQEPQIFATEIASHLFTTGAIADYNANETGEIVLDLNTGGRIVIGDDGDGLTWTLYDTEMVDLTTDGVRDHTEVTAGNVAALLGL